MTTAHTTTTSAFDASLVALWCLVVVLLIATLARHKPPSFFASGVFGVMVALQYFYIYQAARKELTKDIDAVQHQ